MTRNEQIELTRQAIAGINQTASCLTPAERNSNDLRGVLKALNHLDVSTCKPFFEALNSLAIENQRVFEASDKEVVEKEIAKKGEGRSLAASPQELAESSRNRFGFLYSRLVGEITELISDDHPRDIAMVLDNLPDHCVAEILRGLEPVQRLSVVKRLCTDEEPTLAEVLDLASNLRRRLETRDKSKAVSGARQEKIVRVVNMMGDELSEEIRVEIGSQVAFLP